MQRQPAEQLLEDFARLKQQRGHIFARNAAMALGVPEAALLEARELDASVRRLTVSGTDIALLLGHMAEVGDVMVLTRNDCCVHEKTGRFEELIFKGPQGFTFGKEIDLRMFLARWATGFFVTDESARGTRHSFQFFDAAGTAVFKIHAVDGTDRERFLALAEEFTRTGAGPLDFDTVEAPTTVSEVSVDADDLRDRWRRMRNGHQFHRMLNELGITRLQALRVAGTDFARPVPNDAIETMLNSVAASALPIMCFVRSPGCVQIHSGPVATIKRTDGWLNVLDPRFNLHLRDDAISSCFAVTKASTEEGYSITSLDAFAADGSLIVQFFPVRESKQEQPEAWSRMIDGFVQGVAA